MSELKSKRCNYEISDSESPAKKLISDGDILIKQLVENQRNTNISLQEHLQNHKEFVKGTDITPLSRYNPGTSSLETIENSLEYFSTVENLKAAGLTDQDAQLYIDSSKGLEFLCNKHKNWERLLLKQHLEELQNLVTQYNDNKLHRNVAEDSSNSVEYGLSIKPNSIETKLLKFALDNRKGSKPILPHPLMNIKEIEKQRFQHLNEQPLPSLNTIRRKARKLQRRLDNVSTVEVLLKNQTKSASVENKSKWDIKDKLEIPQIIPCVERKVYSCLPRNYYTVRNGEIVKLTDAEASSKQLETAPKLSLEEIKLIPKFKDYTPGVPSKVLYIRNLTTSVKEQDLHQLFNQFNSSIVEYKLMNGKLRGQAFVTFKDEIIAGQALEEINGTFMRCKPVIIQYSLKK